MIDWGFRFHDDDDQMLCKWDAGNLDKSNKKKLETVQEFARENSKILKVKENWWLIINFANSFKNLW